MTFMTAFDKQSDKNLNIDKIIDHMSEFFASEDNVQDFEIYFNDLLNDGDKHLYQIIHKILFVAIK